MSTTSPGIDIWHDDEDCMIISSHGRRDVVFDKQPGAAELPGGELLLTREQHELLAKAYGKLDQALEELLQSGGEGWEEAWDDIHDQTSTIGDILPRRHRI